MYYSSMKYFRILQRLDSKVEIEANAAIYAVDKMCSKSQAFATLTCDKLAIKLQGDKTYSPHIIIDQ